MHLLARLFSSPFASQKFPSNRSRKIIEAESAVFCLGALRSRLLHGLIAVAVFSFSGMYSLAQTFTVTSTADSGTGSLRDAINSANSNSGGSISFDSSLTGQTITLTSGGLTISTNVTIDGQGAPGVTISGNNAYTIFTVNSGGAVVKLANLILTNANGSVYGAVDNVGTLTVANSTFSGNSAQYYGGAIYNVGTLTVANSTFSGNSAQSSGGAILNNVGTLTVANSTFSGNSATYEGGAIDNVGTLTVANSTFSGNSAQYGGGIANFSATTATNSIFVGNSASQWGGGIDDFTYGTAHASYSVFWNNTRGDCNECGSNSNAVSGDPMLLPLGNYGGPTQTMYPMGGAVVCAGSASLAVDGSANPLTTDQRGQPLAACPSGSVTAGAVQPVYLVVNTTADSNDGSCTSTTCSLRDAISAANSTVGADIVFASSLTGKTITLSSSLPAISGRLSILGRSANQLTVSGNNQVGSMFTVNSGSVALFDSLTLANANAVGLGGAINNISDGTVIVTNSTLSNNVAANGGAIFSNGTLTVSNCTFSGNSNAPGLGAAIAKTHTLNVTNSTFFGNSGGGGGAIWGGGGVTTLVNNIFSGNSGGGAIEDRAAQASYNVYWNNTGGDCNSCASDTNAVSGDPTLAPLGYYGGPTQTMPPQTGSAALNAGLYQAGEPTTDQRGASRPSSGAIDIGAVQISGNPPMFGSATPNYGSTAGGTSVTLIGTGLDSVASVSFGSVAATAFSIQSSTSLTAVSPATSSSGVVQIAVSNSSGSGTIPFTYYAPLAFSPAAGSLTASYGSAFNQTFAVSGGSGSYTITSSSLPSFLSLSCSAAQCTLSGTPTQAGSFPFTLTANDATYSGVTASATYTLTVTQATLGISISVPSLTYGGGGQIGVSVAPSGLSITPTGTAQCSIDSGTAAVASLNGSGVASILVASTLSAGSHSLQCSYSGDANYASASGTSSLNVAAAPLTVTANNATRAYGAANPTFTGTVAGAVNGDTFTVSASTGATSASAAGSYPITPTVTGANLANYTVTTVNGTLTITNAALTITANNVTRAYGTANPAFTGSITGAATGDSLTASYSTTATTSSNAGTYPIVPTVTGANISDYTVTAINGTLTITKAPASVSLSSSTGSAFPGQPITLTASVASATSGTPTGTMSFYDGSTLLSTAALSGGQASLTSTALGVGAHSITAAYSGDGNFNTATASTGAAVTVLSPDFTLIGTGLSATQTVIPGNATNFSFIVTPASGTFAGPVSFSVTGLPSGATATFSPSSLPASSTGGQVQLTIQTTKSSPTASLRRLPGGVALALLLFPLMGTRRMRQMGRTGLLALLLLAGGIAGLTGCGAGSGLFAQPPQNYTVTVTVTSGSVQHTINYTLNLQ